MTPTMSDIAELLRHSRTIAVVGLSPKKHRDSYEVAEYLQNHGYRIIPINPIYTNETILGEPCYANLLDAAKALNGTKIDIVDCFRRSEDIPPIAKDAITIGAGCLWMQLDIRHPVATAQAQAAGMMVISDRCTLIDHRDLLLSPAESQSDEN